MYHATDILTEVQALSVRCLTDEVALSYCEAHRGIEGFNLCQATLGNASCGYYALQTSSMYEGWLTQLKTVRSLSRSHEYQNLDLFEI